MFFKNYERPNLKNIIFSNFKENFKIFGGSWPKAACSSVHDHSYMGASMLLSGSWTISFLRHHQYQPSIHRPKWRRRDCNYPSCGATFCTLHSSCRYRYSSLYYSYQQTRKWACKCGVNLLIVAVDLSTRRWPRYRLEWNWGRKLGKKIPTST